MAYRIQYSEIMKKETIQETTNKHTFMLRLVAVAILILTLTLLSKTGKLDYLIPGDKAVTKQAFSTMVENVKAGDAMDTAFTAFCKDIIHGS